MQQPRKIQLIGCESKAEALTALDMLFDYVQQTHKDALDLNNLYVEVSQKSKVKPRLFGRKKN